MKKFLATMLALVMALTLCATAWAEGDSKFVNNVAEVGAVSELTAAMQEISEKSDNRQLQGIETITIKLTADITFGEGDTWGDYIFVGSDNGGSTVTFPTIVIDGNGHTISNMPGALVSKLEYGQSMKIQNLTLNGSKVNVQNDGDVEKGAGAFINMPDSCGNVQFINCKLVNAEITSQKWSGGFVGLAAGYGTITFESCVVENSSISGEAAGGLMGHAIASSGLSVVVNSADVSNNTIAATESDTKVGALFGTAGSDTGSVSVSASVSGNTIKANNNEVGGAIYGRGLYGVTLTLTGGSYDKNPLKDADSTNNTMTPTVSTTTVATVANSNGTIATYNYGDSYVQSAAKNATAGQTVTVTSGSVALTDIPAGVKVVAKEGGKAIVGETEITANSNPDGYVVPCTVTFDADNGTAATTVSVPYNTAVAAPTVPTKDGYVFEHWCLSGSDEAAYDFNTLVTSDITLVAHWTAQSSGGSSNRVHINPTTDTTETKAESPKTFDAGVAVYGLMAISSVLGMGYIGKKKF